MTSASHPRSAGASALGRSLLALLLPLAPAAAQQSETGPGQTPGAGPGAAPPVLRPYAPGTPQLGIGGTPERPATAVLRQDEDWSWLAAERAGDTRALDPFKWAALDERGSVRATLAFDGLVGFERFEDAFFGDEPGEDTTVHVRANAHLGLAFGDRARVYGAIKYGDVGDSRFPEPVAEDDGPDLHQGFVELAFGDALGLDAPHDALARLGRQELHYGAGRLISIRNGPNVRFDFDGALARARIGPVVGDVFAFRPTENDAGRLDNGTDDGQGLWGAYATVALGEGPSPGASLLDRANLDLYYIGHDREVSPYAFQDAPLDETRHTVGARWWTGGPPTEGWNLDLEAAWQFGRARGVEGAGEADVSAGFLAGVISYGASSLPWTPVIASRFGISSGDPDPDDDTLRTFRAPFPPGRYFGESNPIGPGNVAGVGPYLAVHPTERLTLTARYQAFWRVEDEDGLYSPPQAPLRGTAGDERFVGQELSLIADWALGPYLAATLTGAVFDTDAYLGDEPPAEDIGFVQAKLFATF